MSIDPKKIAEWKDNPPGCDCCPEAGEDCFCEAREALPALLSDREEMLALLRRLERVDTSDGEYSPRCPACGASEAWSEGPGSEIVMEPHAPDCRLAAFLKET